MFGLYKYFFVILGMYWGLSRPDNQTTHREKRVNSRPQNFFGTFLAAGCI